MPATASYANVIEVNFNPGTGAYSHVFNFAAGFPGGLASSIGDDPNDNNLGDGSAGDGIEVAGESFFWTAAGNSATYTGYHINGEPIIEYFGTYYLLTQSLNDLTPGTATAGDYTYCFARGTRIATPAGEVAVEALQIGDDVLDTAGRSVAVKWIGRQTLHPVFARLSGQLPVCVRAGALGGGLPRRDLIVTPDHALLVDGVLVHAAALVNGRSIVQLAQWSGDLTYFHIETEAHEIVLAEGAPAETFIDNVSREKFDNFAEYAALYPDAAPMVELSLPRVKFARQLPMAIRRRLDGVADALDAAPQPQAA